MSVIALERHFGIAVARTDKFVTAIHFVELSKRQTLQKCHFFSLPLQTAFLADHMAHGCLLYPQKQHFDSLVTAAMAASLFLGDDPQQLMLTSTLFRIASATVRGTFG